MHVSTDFWTEKKFNFNALYFINGKTKEVMFEADLNDSFKSALFFRAIAKFVVSRTYQRQVKQRTESYEDRVWFQFAVMHEGELTYVKWFDIIIEHDIIGHDFAFETTMVDKNGIRQPLGTFPRFEKWHLYSNRREEKMMARAYKYIANQIMKA
jgi:hypothetical protein